MYGSLNHHKKEKRDEHNQQTGNKENFWCSWGKKRKQYFTEDKVKHAFVCLFVYLSIKGTIIAKCSGCNHRSILPPSLLQWLLQGSYAQTPLSNVNDKICYLQLGSCTASCSVNYYQKSTRKGQKIWLSNYLIQCLVTQKTKPSDLSGFVALLL